MYSLQTLATYPFLQETKKYIQDNGPTIHDLLTNPLYARARVISVERLDNTLQKRDVGIRPLISESDCAMEILSYPLARMLSVCINDPFFIKRYALAEAKHAYEKLLDEPTHFLLNIAQELSISTTFHPETNRISIDFKQYLRYAPTRYKEWKMINREMNHGYITLTHKELSRVLMEIIRKRINQELEARSCDNNVEHTFSADIQRLRNILQQHRKKTETIPLGKLSKEKLPPCMQDILSAINAGENVPHMGRFALVAFLHSLQLSTNEILKLFSSAPDYEEDKTRYQVEHITGSSSATSYKSPGCDKMRTYGICPSEKIDDICKKIKHPRSYYSYKWKQEKKTT